MQDENKKKKRFLKNKVVVGMGLCLASLMTISSSYVVAQENHTFRYPIYYGNTQKEETVTVTAPTNIAFHTNGATTTGNADAGDIVYVFSDEGNLIGGGTVDENGNFSISVSPPLLGGESVTYIAENIDGIESEEVVAVVPDHINIDLTEPYNVMFSENGDVVSGEADPNVSIIIEDESGNIIGAGETDGNGNFSIPVNPSVTGGDDITLSSEDEHGNVSDDVLVTVPDDINVDLTEPYNISFEQSGESISGEADPSVSVTIEDSEGNQIGTGIADSEGGFTIPLVPPVVGGDKVVLRSEDGKGNSSDDVFETVPDGIGVQYDECNIVASRSYANEGDCVWFNNEGEWLGLLVNKYDSFNGLETYFDYVQITPSGPMTYNEAVSGCENNQLNGYDYKLAGQSTVFGIKIEKEKENLEKFSTSDGWTWASIGKAVNIRTGEVKNANHNERYDKYCTIRHVKMNWF